MKVLGDLYRQHGRAIPANVDPQLMDIIYIKRSLDQVHHHLPDWDGFCKGDVWLDWRSCNECWDGHADTCHPTTRECVTGEIPICHTDNWCIYWPILSFQSRRMQQKTEKQVKIYS